MLSYLKQNLHSYFSSRMLIFTLIAAAVIFACTTACMISLKSNNCTKIVPVLLVDLAIFLIFSVKQTVTNR
ncbi:MAG: histidine kinase, partial [Rickettsia endosymbiont of Ixodes ricinus]|nr:histidine kinase [Rickettsia endosymbiont of Ixodes ricinus]